MKKRLASSLVLVFVLSLTLPVLAAPRDPEDRGLRDRRFVIIKVIKKLFGIGTNDDLPTPPKP